MSTPPESSDSEFYAALGWATTGWQHVEGNLSSLFGTCLQARDAMMASEVFYAVANFRDKLSLVDAAVRHAFWKSGPILSEWDNLQKRTRKRSLRRNLLIHSHPNSEVEHDGSVRRQLGPPPDHFSAVTKALSEPQSGYVSIKQIREAGASFFAIAADISEFDRRAHQLLMSR